MLINRPSAVLSLHDQIDCTYPKIAACPCAALTLETPYSRTWVRLRLVISWNDAGDLRCLLFARAITPGLWRCCPGPRFYPCHAVSLRSLACLRGSPGRCTRPIPSGRGGAPRQSPANFARRRQCRQPVSLGKASTGGLT